MDSEEVRKFIIDTPFSSHTTVEEKYERFMQTRATNGSNDEIYIEPPTQKRKSSKTNVKNSVNSVSGRNFEQYVPPPKSVADDEFFKRFTANRVGLSCSVCDRLWFEKDIRPAPASASGMLATEFPNENVFDYRLCENCYRNLCKNYPPIPSHLPPLDPITERLVLPRIVFMQIRRLRFVKGSIAIVAKSSTYRSK
ncbi:ATP-dependent DNA helicase [Aphis craccivora]|uniref:ATP-dependent DNA helicase n=1 Tax=Aphis craccivora TaxID=307492 RepID=A0A6G0X0J8_APHCR|nr:ATP-dependent DNA helicase [Aphis craccivora]